MKARALVAWNLRRLRVLRNMPQDRFAYEAGVDRAYLGKIERQTANPTIDVLDRVAKALDAQLGELFELPAKGALKPKPMKAGRKTKKASIGKKASG